MASDISHYNLGIINFGSSRKDCFQFLHYSECLLFSLDELAKYDAPAAINKVLAVTGKKSLYWIGHSQGTAVGFMTLADNPKYNRKVC